MALRSLGSSLVAKATPGSASRDLLENQINKPALPGKGEIGTTSRDLVSEPQVTPAAPGSEKIVTSTPGIEGSQTGSSTVPPNLLAGGGYPTSPVPGNNAFLGDSGQPSQPAQASTPAVGGKTAIARSGGAQAGPVAASGSILPTGASTSSQADNPLSFAPGNPSLLGTLSGRASADNGGGAPSSPIDVNRGLFNTSSAIDRATGNVISATKTAGQLAAGAAGKVLSSVGATNLGNKLQSFGGSSTASSQGSGSVSNVLRSLAQTVSNISSKLRSLFKK